MGDWVGFVWGWGHLRSRRTVGGVAPWRNRFGGLRGCGRCVGAGQMDVQWKDKQSDLVVDHNRGAGGECG